MVTFVNFFFFCGCICVCNFLTNVHVLPSLGSSYFVTAVTCVSIDFRKSETFFFLFQVAIVNISLVSSVN